MSSAPRPVEVVPTAARFVAVVPVKPPVHAKSRLGQVPDQDRVALATAFALDVVSACRRCSEVAEVLVVTDDAAFATRVRTVGALAIPDGVAGDLNGTLALAVAEATRRWPHLHPVALCADLPALRSEDLQAVLAQVGAELDRSWFVADAEGSGTTLYAAGAGRFAPRFGHGSGAAHRALGVQEVVTAGPSLRRDVDDLGALREAATLGLGEHSRLAAAGLV